MNACGDVAVTISTRHFCVTELLDHGETAHRHSAPWLLFVVVGKAADLDGDEWVIRDRQTAVVRPANTMHLSRPLSDDTRFIIIQSLSAEAERAVEDLAARQRLFRDGRLRPLFLRIWRELNDCDQATGLAVDGAVFRLLAELQRMVAYRSCSRSTLAAQLETFFDAQPDGELVARLAAHNQMSTRTLIRHFRLETGSSVGQYLSHLRAERAKTLLRTTSLSMLEIALRLGYCDRSHFARAFSQAVGMTPSQYRTSIE